TTLNRFFCKEVKEVRVIFENGELAIASAVSCDSIVEKIKKLSDVRDVKIKKIFSEYPIYHTEYRKKKRRSAWGPDWES
ncbi:MAG: hypothetical protein ACPLZH_02410, partial [Minisyncoccales bacterium]